MLAAVWPDSPAQSPDSKRPRRLALPSRGLLKNWLFSVLAQGDEQQHAMAELERRWESMVGRLGSESLPDFLRMHWNSRNAFARQSELFKTIRGRVRTREAVFTLLREMDEDIDTYLALTQPEGSQWRPEWKSDALDLRMFAVRQPLPMLMAARRRLSEGDFGDLLRATVVIAFRFNVIGSQHTGEQERVYHAASTLLNRDQTAGLRQVLEALRPVYRSDAAFRADFAEKSVKTTQTRNAKLVRYILCRLERQAGGTDFDVDSPAYTIEHVLPQSPDAGWDAFSDRDLESFVYRLANMVMLEAGANRSAGNRPYAEKRPALAGSAIVLTRRLAEQNDEWTPARLAARQQQLAAIATAIWRVTQLS